MRGQRTKLQSWDSPEIPSEQSAFRRVVVSAHRNAIHLLYYLSETVLSVRIIETSFRCRLGEGPTWVARLNALFWVDILGQQIHRLELSSGSVSTYEMPEPVGWIVERRGRDDFLVGLKSGVAEFDIATGQTNSLVQLERDRLDNRLNDAKADPSGRLWAGTKDDTDRLASGALYRIDSDFEVTLVDDCYGVPNGPTFSPDGAIMYHADSAARTVYSFAVSEDGSVGERRKWLRFEDEWGFPDGMTTDRDGCVWIAHWGGGRVSRFSPDGKILSSVYLPATNITSCAFAGVDLDRMFVTSATLGYEDEAAAGKLFEIDPGVSGLNPAAFAG